MAGEVTWVTADDVALALGLDVAGDPWLAQVVAGVNVWCYERRAAAGYTDDPTVVPSDRVRLGVVAEAVARWNARAVIGDAYASLEGNVPGAPWSPSTNRYLGIPRPVVV